ncbi:MAG: hypothetical protein A3F13_02765 [Gammaproteobacteria bacterium RIFCSPHIGHO2_12_FULL_40_19]|nr:MAG: hypothetical protein A3F13_02765 [Gammaproteobacteria bacterium RIFCSPHIGHO2_12_FULL_40_19]
MKTQKEILIEFMNAMDFQIHDISYEAGQELIAKKCWDGSIVWWPAEDEGDGFMRLFKGQIRGVCHGQ